MMLLCVKKSHRVAIVESDTIGTAVSASAV